MATFCVRTYGCQMNVYDGDRLRSALFSMGWEETDASCADAVIFVTCSIRDKAEQKVMSEIGLYRPTPDRPVPPLVAITGCMAQRVGADIHRRFPWVRVVCGPRHIGMAPDAVVGSRNDGRVRILLDEDPREVHDLASVPSTAPGCVRAFVTIAHGCDHFCAYCIVPYVRGRFQSRPPEEIVTEVRELAARGVMDITLLGQNVNRYGADRDDGRFYHLLRRVAKIPGIRRVRYATSHPIDFSDELIDTMAETEGVCCAVNLPVQAGSDRILGLMGRGYTVSHFEERIARLRERVPGVAVTSDLIVGFPGETEDDYLMSEELLRRVRFDLVHTAAYSVRPGTKAEMMEGHLEARVKADRLNRVNALQAAISKEINAGCVGRTYEVLVDGPAPKGDGLMQGRTAHDKVVILPPGPEVGSFVNVRINRAENWYLYGEVLS